MSFQLDPSVWSAPVFKAFDPLVAIMLWFKCNREEAQRIWDWWQAVKPDDDD